MRLGIFFCVFAVLAAAYAFDQDLEEEEIRAQAFLAELNEEYDHRRNVEQIVGWAYGSNITEENEKHRAEVLAENAKFYKEKAIELSQFNYHVYKNEDLKRQFKKLSLLGYAALPDDKFRELLNAVSAMESNYAKVRICDYHNRSRCDYQLEPELTEIFLNSTDPKELEYYWVEWYNRAGTPVRSHFSKYVELNNESAVLNNFTSGAEAWLHEYEDASFEQQLVNIFDEIRPLYQQLHAYVRNKLTKKYGKDVVSERGPIPMHLLGNLWAQSWENVAQFASPFPNKKLLDVTEEMIKQNYTPVKMFEMADQFFQSLNMSKVPPSFWKNSILEKPTDGRDIVCHASAWDFYIKDDVRIKQCTRVNMEDFFTAHHEMGHIQYYLQYQHQPSIYRDGANPGFHEAVGDVLSLSVSTPKHLEKIGLLKNYVYDNEATLNQLFATALQKIVFLPFAYTLDKYRWGVFRGEIKPDEYNCRFWKLREEFSGIVPPVQRTEADFDAAAKYHISADVEYLRYLVSFITQFQFHKGACTKAGEYNPGSSEKPLSDCDIYQSSAAGNAFKEMLALGSSKPWPEALEILTDQRKMEASALLEYFKPLQDWLEKTNQENGVHIGWDSEFECLPAKKKEL